MKSIQTTYAVLAAVAVLGLLVPGGQGQDRTRTSRRPLPRLTYGPLELHGYEYAETLLDPPHRLLLPDGRVEEHRWGFQITVRARSFPVRALDPVLHVGDTALVHYVPHLDRTPQALTYTFYDPALARAEHLLEIIYGDDERTRTRFAGPLDPERLERLPEKVRRARRLPELEYGTLATIEPSGRVTGTTHLAAKLRVRLAVERRDGMIVVLEKPIDRDAAGKFAARIPAALARRGSSALLLLGPEDRTSVPPRRPVPLDRLPDRWELLDRKALPHDR